MYKYNILELWGLWPPCSSSFGPPAYFFFFFFFFYFFFLLVLLFFLLFFTLFTFFYFYFFIFLYFFLTFFFFFTFLLFLKRFFNFFFNFFFKLFLNFVLLFLLLPHILPHILPQTTTSIAIHPPMTFFVPKRNTGKCFERKPLPVLPSTPQRRFLYLRETQANVLRGLQRFWGGCEDLATISERRRSRRRSRTDNF